MIWIKVRAGKSYWQGFGIRGNLSLRTFEELVRPSALTVPVLRLSPQLIETIAKFNIPVFTHLVALRSDLEKPPKGVKGIYSSTACE